MDTTRFKLNLVTSVSTLETDTYIESKHGIINLKWSVSSKKELYLRLVRISKV